MLIFNLYLFYFSKIQITFFKNHMEKQSYFIIGTPCPSAPLASQFTLGIESKFKYFGGEIKKKIKFTEASWFSTRELIKFLFTKCRDFIQRVATLAKIESAREAYHHLTLTENCQIFYLHVFVLYSTPTIETTTYNTPILLSNKESVILSPVITTHTLRKKEEIKTVSVLTRFPSSLVPWCILKWLNCWSRKVFLVQIVEMVVRENEEV